MKLFYTILIVSLISIGFTQAQPVKNTTAKPQKHLIQFSGLVVEGDSMLGVPGVHVFNPKTGRGTSTNMLGYFSMPVLPGDTLFIAAVGFRKEKYEIPLDSVENYSVVIELMTDTMMLPMVEIRPFPSERIFKQAFLAINVANDPYYKNMQKNLNDQITERLLRGMEDDGGMNSAYYMNRQIQYMEQRYMYQGGNVSIFDPFAWRRFFKDVEREKQKKKEKERKIENDKGY